MRLYYSPGACSLGVHILIEELGLECEYARIVVADRENWKPEYLAVNPRGKVPALELDGQILTEGPALMVFIESMKPGSGLLPKAGSVELGRCLEWLAWFGSTLHVSYAQLWRPERFLPSDADFETLSVHAPAKIKAHCAEIEARLVGPWLLGERICLADLYLLAFYRWGVRIGLDMPADYPRWTAWKERMLERPAVRRVLEDEGVGLQWEPIA